MHINNQHVCSEAAAGPVRVPSLSAPAASAAPSAIVQNWGGQPTTILAHTTAGVGERPKVLDNDVQLIKLGFILRS
jgi:hypothetical protein